MNADRLKKLRIKSGLNQTQAAKKLNLSRVNYNRYENGERDPDDDTLKVIATFFNVSTDYLLGMDIPESGLVTKDDIRKANITDEELELIKITREEGISVKDIQYWADMSRRYKEKTETKK